MGADLYITKMDRRLQVRGFEVSQGAVDAGYFRDAYNSYGLFAVMSQVLSKELSWWQTAKRKELFNKQNNMTVDGVKKWAAEIIPLIDEFQKVEKISVKTGKGIVNYAPDETQAVKEHALLLKRFLELAIAKKSTIIFSV
jgi:hypothetical protein